jgi:hypothetical protein
VRLTRSEVLKASIRQYNGITDLCVESPSDAGDVQRSPETFRHHVSEHRTVTISSCGSMNSIRRRAIEEATTATDGRAKFLLEDAESGEGIAGSKSGLCGLSNWFASGHVLAAERVSPSRTRHSELQLIQDIVFCAYLSLLHPVFLSI